MIGEFDTPVTFQEKPRKGTTEFNTAKKTTWQNIGQYPTVFCKIQAKGSGDESVQNGRLANTQGVIIHIRHRSDLSVTMSFVIDQVRYYIEDISAPPKYRRTVLRIEGRKSE